MSRVFRITEELVEKLEDDLDELKKEIKIQKDMTASE